MVRLQFSRFPVATVVACIVGFGPVYLCGCVVIVGGDRGVIAIVVVSKSMVVAIVIIRSVGVVVVWGFGG